MHCYHFKKDNRMTVKDARKSGLVVRKAVSVDEAISCPWIFSVLHLTKQICQSINDLMGVVFKSITTLTQKFAISLENM